MTKRAWIVGPELIDRFLNMLTISGFKWLSGHKANQYKIWFPGETILFIEEEPKTISCTRHFSYPDNWSDSDEELNITEVTEELLQDMENKGAAINIVHDGTVSCPSHDNQGGLETINIIKMLLTHEEYCGYLKGSFLKYRERASYKGNTQQDYEKAKWYFDELMKVGSLSSVCFYSDNFDECDNITHEY